MKFYERALLVWRAFFLAVVSLSSAAQAQENANVPFDSQGLEARSFQSFACTGGFESPDRKCLPIELRAYLAKAVASNSLVIVSHGSGGLDRRHSDYARQLASHGISALVVDHWGGRGLTSIHGDYNEARMKGGDGPNMTMDTLLILSALQESPDWSGIKFGYLGESIGASAALNATRPYLRRAARTLTTKPLPTFSAIVALYPGCVDRSTAEAFLPTPFLFVLAEKDDNTPAATCKRQSEWMNSRGGKTEWKELAGQSHDFDAPYRFTYSRWAQNPSKCENLADKGVFKLDATGKEYPGTTAGFAQMRKDCMSLGVTGGNRGDPKTGFDDWTAFFEHHLK